MENRKDSYFRRAQAENYVARSAYKLLELNKKYNLIKKNNLVLDLGSSPGSWAQVCLKLKVKRVVGIDLSHTKVKDKDFRFIKDDIGNIDVENTGKFDVVLSDLAPNTTGNFDAEASVDLSRKAWTIAKKVLKKNGNFVCKVFQGRGFEELTKEIRKDFEFFKISKPDASRKRSKEIYMIGKLYKG